MTKEGVKAYLGYVPVAAALLCIVYYIVFVVAMLMDPDAGNASQRAAAAGALLWYTPFSLAGTWYLTIPAVLVLALGLMVGRAKLPDRLADWRPHGIWQGVLFYVPAVYGIVAAALFGVLALLAIPSTFLG